jgi:hypothetical protein
MKRALAALMISAPLMLSGCAVQGRPFERVHPAAQNAVIYVYRPYNYAGSLLRPAVTCGEETARIGPGGYHAYVVPAGQVVTCSAHSETADEVEIHTEPRVYYIREEIGWGVLTGHPHLNPMDVDTAQDEIQRCCVQEQ